jgi:hypothetical protein
VGGDVIDEPAEGIGGETAAVPAAGVSVEAGADQAEHGGERDQVRVDAGQGARAGSDGCDHVVDQEECPCFLPGEGLGLAAQDAAGAAEGFLQVKERDFNRPPLIPINLKSSLVRRLVPRRYLAWEHCCRRRRWFAV